MEDIMILLTILLEVEDLSLVETFLLSIRRTRYTLKIIWLTDLDEYIIGYCFCAAVEAGSNGGGDKTFGEENIQRHGKTIQCVSSSLDSVYDTRLD